MIVDNRMPAMSALELIQKQNVGGCKWANQNKLILSTERSEKQLNSARTLGCTILKKPFKLKAISAWIDERAQAIVPGRQLAGVDFENLFPLS